MKNAIEKMQSVKQLINNKMMLVDASNFHVSMLAELWNIYNDDARMHLCRNIRNYCNVQNAMEMKSAKSDAVLLISIKDSAGDVAPYAYFKNDTIELITGTEAIRTYPTKVAKFVWKLLFKIAIAIIIVVGAIVYFALRK